ncbi:putative ABC transporter ATP-binding protein YxlF (plasmid) [Geobacillus thermodenitrificans]|jgi:ABC-2 type transport system ATP-binding protein|uniref:ATP-binding cassette domain-containing protein n=1 Tax=Geobacillus thermodenitrificans TaxID=33940 RepID=UPI000A294247|nr:ATP-binding cassette domain-containing protein [Geobacillus thermodenitrificans]ARP44640.1 putative ABC transporter ATP-binding protein YxlF [Geobacillus thermodenitrificans]
METIIISNLSKSFNKTKVLENINLNISKTYGLLGPNGAGKTTLMRILATLLPFEEGYIHYKGCPWDNTEQIRRFIGYLPQHFSAYKQLKVFEVLDHFAILKGITNRKIRYAAVEEVLDNVNLLEQRNKKVKHLSGGMVRRLGIAQALIGNPEILIVDEPTAGLDIQERVRFRKLLRKVSKGRHIVISSHIVEDLETICDRLSVIKQGKILFEGSRAEMISLVEGMIWEKEVTADELEFIPDESLISTKELEGNYKVRLFSKQPPQKAESVSPTIEDAYLYIMKENQDVEQVKSIV